MALQICSVQIWNKNKLLVWGCNYMNNLLTSLNLNFTEKVWMHRTSLKTWTITTWMWLLFWLSCPFISVCAYCISTLLDIFSRLRITWWRRSASARSPPAGWRPSPRPSCPPPPPPPLRRSPCWRRGSCGTGTRRTPATQRSGVKTHQTINLVFV